MSNLQAACGVAQLEQLDATLRRKREIGQLYSEALAGVPGLHLPPDTQHGELNSYWVYGVVVDEALGIKADAVMQKLGAKRVGTRPFFWPMHEQPVFRKMGLFNDVSCPNAECASRQGFYLPSGLGLGNAQIRRVAADVWSVMSELTVK